MIREMMLKLTHRPSNTALGFEEKTATEPSLVEEGGDNVSEASNSSRSSNSSSSSSDKKSKKNKSKKSKKNKNHKDNNKKDKKHKKAKPDKSDAKENLREAMKLKSSAEKAERNRVSKIKVDAGKVMAKVAPTLTQLGQLLIEPHVAKMPAVMIKKIKDGVVQLKTFHKEATEKLRLKDPLDLTFEIDDVGPIVKDARATIKLMTSMLVAVGKL